MSLCGCGRCEKTNNGFGTWPSKEAMYECGGRKDGMKSAYRNGTGHPTFVCEHKTIRPIRPEPIYTKL